VLYGNCVNSHLPDDDACIPDCVPSTTPIRIPILAFIEGMFHAVDLHWSNTDEGATHLDPIPNPGRYLIGTVADRKLAIDCGPAGVGIGPGH
jgi:hypothetical protein